jgi:N-terminal domain of toast_rack, DUF2154
MNRKLILIAFLVFTLVTMACGVEINLPNEVKTGPTRTEQISVPLPDNPQAVTDLTISFAGGKLDISPGAKSELVSGTATYNVSDFQPKVVINGNNVEIKQGDLILRGVPAFNNKLINEWILQLADVPMDLRVNAGAYSGTYELGGLNLQRLAISDGASDVKVYFSEPNQTVMDLLEYNTGASSVTLEGLANANFDTMFFRSGAGNYRLDFSGNLQHDMTVSIESGISSIILVIPEGTAAEVEFDGGLSNVSTSGGWDKDGNSYTLSGSGPMIKILVKMGAGNLDLRTR